LVSFCFHRVRLHLVVLELKWLFYRIRFSTICIAVDIDIL
jgi:hypothetical protein